MKVAVLAPIAWRTPPRHYGPWEQVASNIAEGLIEQGVEVTLFATGDSITAGTLQSVCDRSYEEDKSLDPKVWECLHISQVMEQSRNFDLIHNNYDFLPLTYSGLIKTPVLTTIHGFSSPQILPVYKKYNRSSYYVSISDSDRSPELDYIATVYNGLNVSDFTFNPHPDEYLLYFGRIHHDKGTYEAIEIARGAGRKLIIAGIIQDETYFREKVEPYLDGENIIYAGHAGPEQRDELLGSASALLHPVNFDEPFGLSVVESMLCGTPVIAMNRGSMPEIIRQGETGFLTDSVMESIEAVESVSTIERGFCRKWAADNFSREKMVENYLQVYHRILNR